MSGRDAIIAGEAAERSGDFLSAAAAYQSGLVDADPLIVADAQFHLGRVSWRQGRFDEAVEQYEAARGAAVRHHDDNLRARVENGLGAIHFARGAFEQARASYAVAFDSTDDPTQRGRVLLNLGAIANIQGDLDQARAHYARSRSIFEETGYARGAAMALHNIGMLHADQGEWEAADESYRHCLVLLEAEGDRQMIANVLLNRSEVGIARSAFDEAVAACDLALSIYAEIGDEVGRGEGLRWKGHALRRLGRHDEAERALHEAARIAQRTQAKLLEAEALRELGESLCDRGATAEGRTALARAFALFQELGARREVGDLRDRLGRLTL